MYKGYSVITLTGPNAIRTLNQIITPGPGQVGAYITARGFIVPGTTLIDFPNGVFNPQIILSQKAISTTTSIPVTINAAQMTIPKVPVKNPSFTTPQQTSPPHYTIRPNGPGVGWSFAGSAGIAGQGSIYTNNNPPPAGTQVGFIENIGSISQLMTLMPGRAYALSFLVAQRRLNNGSVNSQTLHATVGNNVIGDFTPTQTVDGSYVLFTSDAFTVPTAGSYNIVIAGTNADGGDNTALIDQVVVTGGLIVQSRR
jgi:hypothetical protein